MYGHLSPDAPRFDGFGLVIKQTKGRRAHYVPILDPLEPVLRPLTNDKELTNPLVRGPRGGVLTTANGRDATKWDTLVASLVMPVLSRHTGAI